MAVVNPKPVMDSLNAERFVPAEMLGIMALEHWHRYLFAAPFASGKIVLDLACGDGYGSLYLAGRAKRVYGIDISGPTIAQAKQKYSRRNLEFVVGSCVEIPLADHLVDVVVSFETIEHHDEHARMLSEFKRVLKPRGLLIISTPDKRERADTPRNLNPYHVKELCQEEIQSLLQQQFGHVRLLAQRVMFGSVIAQVGAKTSIGRHVMRPGDVPEEAGLEPDYWIALASDKKLPEAPAGILDDIGLVREASQNRGRNKALTAFIGAVALPGSKVLGRRFLEDWYTVNNTDVISQGLDPEAHWLKYGQAEGRLPAKDLVGLVEDLVLERVEAQYSHLCDALKGEKAQQADLLAGLRQKEADLNGRLESLQQDTQRERELLIGSAQLQLGTLAEDFKHREVALSKQVQELNDELLENRKKADELAQKLHNEINTLRLRARYEVEALLRSEAEKARELLVEFGKQQEASRAAWERTLDAERESSRQRVDALKGELDSKENSWQRRLEQALKVVGQLRQQLDCAHDREQELCHDLRSLCTTADRARNREKELSRDLRSLRTTADRAREADRQRVEQVLKAETAKAHLRGKEALAQISGQLQLARAEAQRARTTDREHMDSEMHELAGRFRDREAHLGAIADALRRRIIGIEKSLVWRLRSLFVPDVGGAAMLDPGTENGGESIAGSLTQYEGNPVQLAHQMPLSLSELLMHEDREFVELAYLGILGRAADPAGLLHYLEALRSGTDKLRIVRTLHASAEGRAHGARLVGLAPAMSRYRWRRLPLVAYFQRQRETKQGLSHQLRLARAEVSKMQDRLRKGEDALQAFSDFDPQTYLSINSDVARAGTNPYEHFVRFGFRENRRTRASKQAEVVWLTCDWLVARTSAPVAAETPAVDVIIPIFNGYDFLEPLIESVLANTRPPYRLLLIDDCSTDERIPGLLSHYATKSPAATVLTNSVNLGFIGSVNRAMELVESEFFVLLNSDTEVPPRWLERLTAPLQQDARIASVTPFSNAATICSFPVGQADNPLYLGLSATHIDRAFDDIGDAVAPIDIPTGVGFCMAMRKSVLDLIGSFDTVFGRGYGEENDWCMRASAHGYRHVMAANLFVYHKHGGSFQTEEKARLIRDNLHTLAERYPNYASLIETHVQLDPSKAIREFVKLRLLSEATGGVTLVVDHGLGGGANAFRSDLVKAVVEGGKAAVVLISDAQRSEEFQLIAHGRDGEARFSLAGSKMLEEMLRSIQVADVIYNNLVGSADPLALIRHLSALTRERSWALRIMMHDFYPICPSYTLIDSTGGYCGVPDRLEICERCMGEISRELLPIVPPSLDIRDWRAAWHEFLQLAQEIRCFSESSKQIISRAYPQFMEKCTVVPHATKYTPRRLPLIQAGPDLHIGVVGGINYPKGRGVIETLVHHIKDRKLEHRISIVGETDIPVPGVNVTGRYDVDQLPDIIESLGINAILIPSIWPETFSYVTSEMMALGLPVACFNIGAPAERVRNYAKGIVLDARDPETILRGLSHVVSNLIADTA